MAEIKLRLNLDRDEVELVVDNEVTMASGPDVFASWVKAYNDKHVVAPPAHTEPVKIDEPIPTTPVSVEVPVNENVIESPTLELNTDKEKEVTE